MAKRLVVQAARFGDLVQTKRLLLSLEKRGAVGLCADGSLRVPAEALYPAAEFYPVAFHSSPNMEKLRANEETFSRMRKETWEKIYNCNFSSLALSVSRMFPRQKTIGYRPDSCGLGGAIKAPWIRLAFRMSRFRVAATLNLVDFWAHFTRAPLPGETINPPATKKGGGVGVVCAGRESRRSLRPALTGRLAELASDILGGAPIKIFGLEAQSGVARAIERAVSPKKGALNLAGKTDWKQLINEIGSLDLLLTPDTGTMHLAAALGTPTMSFFLSSAFCHETAAYGQNHLIWQALAPCSPCLENRPCPYDLRCAKAFENPEFPRMVAAALLGKEIKGVTEGLQLWRTDFDNLGQKLRLLAGEDALSSRRETSRALLKKWLGLNDWEQILENASSALLGELVSEFFPEEEWALPDRRYY